MRAYSESYLKEVVENQGKLFDSVREFEPGIDVESFIEKYMISKTRKYIDDGQAYVCTLAPDELWNYFRKTDNYTPNKGNPMRGFSADWIGQFYAYFQWYYNMASENVIKLVPLEFIRAAYYGLHDLDLDLAVKKVGDQVVG